MRAQIPTVCTATDVVAFKVIGDRAVMDAELFGEFSKGTTLLISREEIVDLGWSKASANPESGRV